MSLLTLILKFLEYLWSYKRYSLETISGYKKSLVLFHKYMQVTYNKLDIDVSSVTKQDIDNFIIQLSNTPPGKTSSRHWEKTMSYYYIYSHITHIRCFLRYCQTLWVSCLDPEKVEWIKKDVLKKDYTPRHIIDQMIEIPLKIEKQAIIWIRNKLFLSLLYGTWCRIGELLKIKLSDIPVVGNHVTILGKGRKYRQIYISDNLKLMVEVYREMRKDKLDRLFVTHKWKLDKVSKRAMQIFISAYREKLWIEVEVTAHTFRRAFASHLLEKWANIRVIQELLWHEYLTTTQKYTLVSQDQVLDTVKLLNM